MLKLWKRSVLLFFAWPVLWIPKSVSVLCTVVLYWLRQAATQQILASFSHSRSVMGDVVYGDSYESRKTILLFLLPMNSCVQYLIFSTEVIALVLTFYLVRRILRGERPAWDVLHELSGQAKRVFWATLAYPLLAKGSGALS